MNKTTTQNESKSIDLAIDAVSTQIEEHRDAAAAILKFLRLVAGMVFSVVIIFSLTAMGLIPLARDVLPELYVQILVFATLAIFTLVFSVLMSVYKFHLHQAAKSEHFKMGFWRIRVAANNQDAGFQTEVRESLTKDAFEYTDPSKNGAKSKQIESPIPGHPGSDLGASVLNKVLDSFDFKAEKKGS